MVAKTDPVSGLSYGWTYAEDGWNTGMDANLIKLGAIQFLTVQDEISAPPTTPTEGDIYFISGTGTGVWTGKSGKFALWIEGDWAYITPKEGWEYGKAGSTTKKRLVSGVWQTLSSGGGGGSISVIETDTTLDVPTGYATITAALDYVRSSVRLNGAIVTIAVDGSVYSTIDEQIYIEDDDLSNVHIQFTNSPSIDITGFIAHALSLPAFITLKNSSFGSITGSITKIGSGAAAGILLQNSRMITGKLEGATFSISGFLYNVASFGSDFIGYNTTFSGSSGVSVLAQLPSNVALYQSTVTAPSGSVGVSFGNGVNAHLNSSTITTTNQAALIVDSSTASLTSVQLYSNNPYTVLNCSNAQVFGDISKIEHTSATYVITSFKTNMNIGITNMNNLTVSGSSNFLNAAGGQVTVDVGTYSGSQTGVSCTATKGAVVSFGGGITAANANYTAGPSITVNTPSANGLILG